MSVAAASPHELQAYLSAVREALADLPAEERNDLLSEVEASLADSASEGGSLTARLGPPHEFAAELRTAAGLHAGKAPAPWRGFAHVVDALRTDPTARAAWGLVTQLAPIWWVVRGYLAVALYAVAADLTWVVTYPIPRMGGSAETGLAVIVFAIAVSVAVGLLTRTASLTAQRLAIAANVVLLASTPVVLDRIQNREAVVTPVVITDAPPGLTFNGQRVENVYPYSRDGKLLHDILLFDSFGRPLTIPGSDPQRRFLKTPTGRTIFNSFPIRHYEAGTKIVANPDAAPRVWLPKVATPPLRQRR